MFVKNYNFCRKDLSQFEHPSIICDKTLSSSGYCSPFLCLVTLMRNLKLNFYGNRCSLITEATKFLCQSANYPKFSFFVGQNLQKSAFRK